MSSLKSKAARSIPTTGLERVRRKYYWDKVTGEITWNYDLLKWAKWFETADRHVKQTKLKNGKLVSTIFLGLDHNLIGKGKPVLFETMVFVKDYESKDYESIEQWRYATEKEAIKGHQELVRKYSHGKN